MPPPNRHAPDGEHAQCPRCGDVKVFKHYATKQQRQSWTCTACGHHLHPTAGTIFHRVEPQPQRGFGNFKTGMRGTYKFVSRKWLQSYLDEYAWRHNYRRTGQRSMFHALVREAANQ